MGEELVIDLDNTWRLWIPWNYDNDDEKTDVREKQQQTYK